MYSPNTSTSKVVSTAHSKTESSSKVSLMVGFGTRGIACPAPAQSEVQDAQSLGSHPPILVVKVSSLIGNYLFLNTYSVILIVPDDLKDFKH